MGNRGLLVIIIVLLVGIFGVMAFNGNGFGFGHKKTLGDSVDEAVEEIGDEIDDHTTGR
jgi:hypothetical protein